MAELKACPFCGWHMDGDLRDIIYPTGSYAHWIDHKDHGMGLHFTRHGTQDGRPAAYAVFQVGCTENMGGCGARVTGFGRDGAIAAWNRRASIGDTPAPQSTEGAGGVSVAGYQSFCWQTPLVSGDSEANKEKG